MFCSIFIESTNSRTQSFRNFLARQIRPDFGRSSNSNGKVDHLKYKISRDIDRASKACQLEDPTFRRYLFALLRTPWNSRGQAIKFTEKRGAFKASASCSICSEKRLKLRLPPPRLRARCRDSWREASGWRGVLNFDPWMEWTLFDFSNGQRHSSAAREIRPVVIQSFVRN